MNENADELLRAQQAVASARVALANTTTLVDELERGLTLAQSVVEAENFVTASTLPGWGKQRPRRISTARVPSSPA